MDSVLHAVRMRIYHFRDHLTGHGSRVRVRVTGHGNTRERGTARPTRSTAMRIAIHAHNMVYVNGRALTYGHKLPTLWLADGDAALPLVCFYTFYRESQCHGIHSLLSHVRSSPQHLTPHFSWQQRVQVDRVAQRLLEEVVTRRRCPERAAAGALRRRSRRREPRRHGGACRHLDGSGRATAEGS